MGNITGGNITSLGTVTAAGNIGSTQQTIIGTANDTASSTGNIVMSGRNIATDVVFAPDASNTTTPTGGRILIGSGVAGNTSIETYDVNNVLRGPRVAIMDSYTKNNSAVVSGQLTTYAAVSLEGNSTLTTSRVHGITSLVAVSGGAAGNTWLPTVNGGVVNNGLNAINGVLQIGAPTANLVTLIGANITAKYATATSGILQINGNGTVVGNGYGHFSSIFTSATGNVSISNVASYSLGFSDLVTTTATVGNTIGYLFPNHISGLFGLQSIGNSFQRGNLYAFMNAGNLAQVRLGSTREQHYYAYPHTTTTGNVIVDASNGKVQTLTPTGNVTITDFTNFVSSAFNNGTSATIPQQDDVTLIITQPEFAPFYTVTLPTTVVTGGYPVQYQNGLQTVASTSYARTFVTIRPSPSGTNGFPWYVSVAASSGSLAAAGSNTMVQFNDANNMGANIQFTYDKTTNLLGAGNINVYQTTGNVWGNLNAGNITTTGATSLIYSTGNITSAGQVSAVGNITGGNISTAGQITATGNVTGGNVLTGIVSATGNVIGSNVFTGGSVSATGKVIAGTDMSAIGNVVAGNIYTTGTSTLGSIQSYSQLQYTLGTSGTIDIDKTQGQVQLLAPVGNVTIGSLTNFVTTQSSQNQADTVTLVIKQGATPYTITMPTGNAAIKYAGNITSVGTTANSVTMASISAANVSGSALYLITVSPEFQ